MEHATEATEANELDFPPNFLEKIFTKNIFNTYVL